MNSRRPLDLRFPRLTRERALASDVRKRILQTIRADPGITLAGVSKAVGIDFRTAEHHVRVLRKIGLLEEYRVSRRRHLYENGNRFSDEDRVEIAARRHGTRDQIVTLVRANPSWTIHRLACEMRVSRSTVHWHLCKLRRAGLVHRRRVKPFLHEVRVVRGEREKQDGASGPHDSTQSL